MADNIDLDPVELLAVGTVGQPGQRRFFLQAASRGRRITLGCEKFHIQGLVLRIQQLLETHGLSQSGEIDVGPTATAQEPLEALWAVGELGLGYHDSRHLFVIVAREVPSGDQPEEPEEAPDAAPSAEDQGPGATARFWATASQVRAFARQAEQVLRGGRPVCTYCGLPIDPAGHPCPASNGARPIF